MGRGVWTRPVSPPGANIAILLELRSLFNVYKDMYGSLRENFESDDGIKEHL